MGTSNQNTAGKSRLRPPRGFRGYLALVFLLLLGAQSSFAQTRLVARDTLGLTKLLNVCQLLGCTVDHGLGDPSGQLFLVKVPPLLNGLNLNIGFITVEADQGVQSQRANAGPAPYYLTDETPINYYGTIVWRGYVTQPAYQLILANKTQSTYNAAGSGITVAVIDTGVDPNHPVLKNSLVSGYDFTRNKSGGSEMSDVSQSTVAVLDNASSAQVSQSTVAVLDQSTVAVLDGNPKYAAFGHGTMTSGIVHLVAPQAKIMPLKSFQADGTGYNSDILSAIY
jgi:subtilisin family serine protease